MEEIKKLINQIILTLKNKYKALDNISISSLLNDLYNLLLAYFDCGIKEQDTKIRQEIELSAVKIDIKYLIPYSYAFLQNAIKNEKYEDISFLIFFFLSHLRYCF